MSLPSTYHLHHSLPNRSPSQRPLSLSLNDYQPLNFDREATEHAYQQSLSVPESSTVSSMSGHSQTDFGGSVETAATGSSTLSHHLKAGDNPHGGSWSPPPNLAGLGTGHSLTPPGSPEHASAARQNQAMLSPVLQSPRSPPTPHAQYFEQYPASRDTSQQRLASPNSSGEDYERGFSAMSVNDENGYTTDPGGPGLRTRPSRRRRSLPSVPSDVPTPVSNAAIPKRINLADCAPRSRLAGSESPTLLRTKVPAAD